MFGGTERVTGDSFLVEVDKRDAATLLPIIDEYILPGSIILSDQWKAYSSLNSCGYTHGVVNHSKNFVDPNTGVHTQQVESMWAQVKRMMREEGVMNSQLFVTYLPEFMWRRKFGKENAFSNFLSHIMEQYPF